MAVLNLMDPQPTRKEIFDDRRLTEPFRIETMVRLTLASAKAGEKNAGRLNIRFDDETVTNLRKVCGAEDGRPMHFVVLLQDRPRMLSVRLHPEGYALSGNEIQVTTLARMNANGIPPDTFDQCDATFSTSKTNQTSWTVNIPPGFDALQYWDWKADGTRLRNSKGRARGAANKDVSERRGDATPAAAAPPPPAAPAAPAAPPPNIYPIRLMCGESYGTTFSDSLVRDVWLRIRPKNLLWYALDGTMPDPGTLLIQVREMADSFHGGIGKVIHEVTVRYDDMTESERVSFRERIVRSQHAYAEEEYERRVLDARNKRIEKIAKELFGDGKR